ncbi:MAG: malto-oligosyltrehalose trehalohydrolase [Desulfohalobium sp.]
MNDTLELGAWYSPEATRFTVWAPLRTSVHLRLHQPQARQMAMEFAPEDGCWRVEVPGLPPQARYSYILDQTLERPDPASFAQPEGVHGPSEVVDHSASQGPAAAWAGPQWEEAVFYELHVGTFTAQGTFEAIIPRLPALKELGVTCLSLMPVAHFPGQRNWGYDGVYPFAAHTAYGGVHGLKRLVDACHSLGLGVVLDVVYNHFGPEGNYLRDFGPYFTDVYHTPWGEAVNFDGPYSDGVRRYCRENALYWLQICALDGLRLDAVHAIYDARAVSFLEELSSAVDLLSRQSGRKRWLIAESDRNDARFLRPFEQGGIGLHAQWNDDFHHAAHALMTGERHGFYQDFGRVADVAEAWRNNYVYSGRYSPFRRRRHGNSATDRPKSQFVVCVQNHDQVGNRMHGDRMSTLVSFDALKVLAALLCLGPFQPMLFMGEEYGEQSPFPYFIDHSDPKLVRAVRTGRKNEFKAFWQGSPPDPKALATFQSAVLNWDTQEERAKWLWSWHTRLLSLRREHDALGPDMSIAREIRDCEAPKGLFMHSRRAESEVVVYANVEDQPISSLWPLPQGRWQRVEDSSARRWGGLGTQDPEEVAGEYSPLLGNCQVQVWSKIGATGRRGS